MIKGTVLLIRISTSNDFIGYLSNGNNNNNNSFSGFFFSSQKTRLKPVISPRMMISKGVIYFQN